MEQMSGHFDDLLGGNVGVVPHLSLMEFGQHRIDEICMLHAAIEEPPCKGQAFQRLPKHMRRRQMSQNDSRLPRRIRALINSKNKEAPPKRPSRRFRRQPRNLLRDFIRRQREKVWLETHIWHAKRFIMDDLWGYKVPSYPTNKTFRANYRASARHCLLLDVSYYNCIQVVGGEKDLLQGLQKCVNPACGLTFAARYFLDGSREGSVVMFHPGRYPYGVIGEVTFLWMPIDDSVKRKLWLWVHPAQHEELSQCLKQVFDLKEEPPTTIDEAATKESIKLSERNVPYIRVPVLKSDNVEMCLLKDTLNRFRLVGPLSSSILAKSLVPAEVESLDLDIQEIPTKKARLEDSLLSAKNCETWIFDVCDSADWTDYWKKQKEMLPVLGKITSPTQVPPHSVLSILALDPRLNKPWIRTKCLPLNEGQTTVENWQPDLAKSLLWNPLARDAATTSKPSTWDIDQARSKKVVPEFITTGAKVPLILIQNPGCRGPERAGFASGWDVISPAGWAMPLWTCFLLCGARPGGVRESAAVSFESRNMKSGFQPDSKAGRTETERLKEVKRSKYLALPPAKRPNYCKMGIPSPFLPLWSTLLDFWEKERTGDFYVLRDRARLEILAQYVAGVSKEAPECRDLTCAIVPIAVSCLTGLPSYLAHLYLPTPEDVEAFNANEKAHMEPKHRDRCSDARKATRDAHKKELRSQRRRRRKERAELAELISKQPLGTLLPDEFVTKRKSRADNNSYKDKMAELWLPSLDNALCCMEACSRRLLGYVTSGDFSMTEARGAGLGYIVLPAVLKVIQQNSEALLLLRNVNQMQYHYTTFRVLVE